MVPLSSVLYQNDRKESLLVLSREKNCWLIPRIAKNADFFWSLIPLKLLKRLLVTTQSCRVLLAQVDFTCTKNIVLSAFDHNFDQYKATTEITITTTMNHCNHNIAANFIITRWIFERSIQSYIPYSIASAFEFLLSIVLYPPSIFSAWKYYSMMAFWPSAMRLWLRLNY